MKTRKLHEWDLTYEQARDLQIRLARRVRFSAMKKKPTVVAGLDCAFSKDGQRILAAAVVLEMPNFAVIETAMAARKVDFPYIPGLLSFREAPACIDAIEKLKTKPDVFVVDGQGIAHPRRFGIASHIGVLVDKPTVGCAKSRLTGSFDEPGKRKGSYSLLTDSDEVIGAVVRTRTDVKCVFVSVGNKCTLGDAIKVILECTTKYRLPEPSRLAHQLVSRAKLRA
ncbi:MAG: deoxyribonuclease V [Sedimentisphaerales bacterium]|jgi:deoxyribonuclease V